jgi:translation initiation factor IF-3
VVEQRPNLDGRNMTMMLGPSKAILSGQYGADDQATGDIPPVEDDAEASDGDARSEGTAGDSGAVPTAAEAAAQAAAAEAAGAAAAADERGPTAGGDAAQIEPESERAAAASGRRRRS